MESLVWTVSLLWTLAESSMEGHLPLSGHWGTGEVQDQGETVGVIPYPKLTQFSETKSGSFSGARSGVPHQGPTVSLSKGTQGRNGPGFHPGCIQEPAGALGGERLVALGATLWFGWGGAAAPAALAYPARRLPAPNTLAQQNEE